MLINRRSLLVGTAALAALFDRSLYAQGGVDWKALAVEDSQLPLLPPGLQGVADQPSLNGPISAYLPFGTATPTDEEKVLARRVLDQVPTGVTPAEVAIYFLNVASGKYGDELRPYTTAWPVRWNPVIVEFFTATNTRPSGDTTAWCAAFVNYCLLKSEQGKSPSAGSAQPTMSAASRSFRTWARQTDSPISGDLVVFKDRNSPGNGHVGFFIAKSGERILVLGGNQFEGTPVRHAINRKLLAKNGGVLQFLSYRTDPQLHA
jgi:uncharacterized protein (TIGR02594 family)